MIMASYFSAVTLEPRRAWNKAVTTLIFFLFFFVTEFYTLKNIGVELLHNVSVSAVQQSQSAICTHMSPPRRPPPYSPHQAPALWVIAERQAECPVLHSSFPVAVVHTRYTPANADLSVRPTLCLSPRVHTSTLTWKRLLMEN